MNILEMIYSACSTLAIIGWLALVVAPLNRGYAVPFARGAALILAVAYLTQLFTITQDTGGDFSPRFRRLRSRTHWTMCGASSPTNGQPSLSPPAGPCATLSLGGH